MTAGGTSNGESASTPNSGGHGVFAEQLARAAMRSASVTGSANNDLSIFRGAQIDAHDMTTTNGDGSPDAADTNDAAFNSTESDQGIIWA